LNDSNLNRWWIEALLTGKYPQNLVDCYGPMLSRVLVPGDEKLLLAAPDFLGINYYCDGFVRSPRPEDKPAIEGGFMPFPQRADGSAPVHLANDLTAMGWVVTPEGLGNLVKRVHRDYPQIPYLVITENGSSYDDVKVDGEVIDTKRTAYLVAHLQSLQAAISEGAPVKGYFAWSLLDNFEWAEGYAKRFGIVHVDYETFERTPKLSFKKYKEIIGRNSAN
jgi:beta-glucosidase